MEKIKLFADLYSKLTALCEAMRVTEDAKAPNKMAEHLREARRMTGILANETDKMEECAEDALDQLYEKNFVDGIASLSVMVEQVQQMRESVDKIYADLAHTLCALRELTESAGWNPVCTDEEICAAIDEGFELTNVMSLGYYDGTFALLFEKGGESEDLVMPPVVIAVGDEECYDDVRYYIEQFMDMEEECV